MTVDVAVCVACDAPRPNDGPTRCPACGQAGRVYMDDGTITAKASVEVEESIGTVVWSLWARRAYKECDDAREARRSKSQADDLPAIVFAVAAAAFALSGVAGDLEKPHGGAKQHPATPVSRPYKPNRGDHAAALFLYELGRSTDAARWQDRMHHLFVLRNDFGAHATTQTGPGPVTPARAALTLGAAEDAVAVLRECLGALHTAGIVTVPEGLR